jgi:hypothetical protein
MTKSSATLFSVPAEIGPSHIRVRAYWDGLRRGDNEVPFWDDVNPSALADLADNAMLLDVFDNPLRFRFAIIGQSIAARYGQSINGKFLDEVNQRPPFDQLDAQCLAAVERQSPTYFRRGPSPGAKSYSRLVLPLWGEGRVSMLLTEIAV